MTKAKLKQKGEELYSVRQEIAALRKKEESIKKAIGDYSFEPLTVNTPDGKRTMMVTTDESIVLKDNDTIRGKIGDVGFFKLAKIGISDLKTFCDKEGFGFKWFIKKKVEGATKIIFTE